MPRLRISVALCTYQGELHLQEQLDSIARQIRLPDELIVRDDGSSDGTLDIVRNFAASARFPVLWGKNAKNLGSTGNFQQAIGLCTGDIIALCDQDDVWHADKLGLMEEMYLSSPETGGVFSNAAVVGADLSPLGYTLWDTFRFPERVQASFSAGKAFDVLLNHNVVTGATMSFRSSMRGLLFPIPAEWIHDAWIAIIVSLYSDLRFINRCLVDYRQHDSQQIGGRKRGFAGDAAFAGTIDDYSALIRQYRLLEEHLLKLATNPADHWHEKLLGKVAHLEMRTANYRRRSLARMAAAVRELLKGRYHRYSNGWLSFFKDLFHCAAPFSTSGDHGNGSAGTK